MKYNKLVRDRIPEIIKEDGKVPITETASTEEYKKYLIKKLEEEIEEYKESHTTDELVDVLEVIFALSELNGVKISELENQRSKKQRERGSFNKRIILKEVK